MNTRKYDVFISYRRDKEHGELGAAIASLVRMHLEKAGLKVFMDVTNLHRGSFPAQIKEAIEDSGNLILILSPGALDRCDNPEDWVRRELETAEHQHIPITAVRHPEFKDPDGLPFWMSGILKNESATWIHEYQEAAIAKLLKLLQCEEKEIVSDNDNADEAERLFREGRKQENGAYERCDMEKALKCYRAAAEMGHPDAQFEVGSAYSGGWGGRVRDMDLAVEWWQKALAGDSPDAMDALANLYKEGNVLAKDERRGDELYKKAFPIWKRRAAVDDSYAQRRLADCYAYGIGTSIDEQLSLTWYRKAAEGNDIWALLALGLWRNCSDTLGDDEEKKWRKRAIFQLRDLAQKGNPWCQNEMGEFYSGFYGNEDANLDEAVRWYEKAAEQGVASAMYNLGVRYLKGDGIEVNLKKASRLLAQAVQNGSESALYDYGVCLLLGLGEVTDENKDDKAIDCLRKCASQYNPEERSGIVGSEESYKIINMFDERVGRSGRDAAIALACVECCGILARAHDENGQSDEFEMGIAVSCLKKGRAAFRGEDACTAAQMLRDIAHSLCEKDSPSANELHYAADLYNEALKLVCDQTECPDLNGEILFGLAKAFQSLKETKSALRTCQKAVACFTGKKQESKAKKADCLSLMGSLQLTQGHYMDAVTALQSANGLYKELQDGHYRQFTKPWIDWSPRFPLATNYYNLAKCFVKVGNNHVACSSLLSALGELKALENSKLDSVRQLKSACESLLANARPFNWLECGKVSELVSGNFGSLRLAAKTGWYNESKFCDMIVFDDATTIPLLLLPEKQSFRLVQCNGRGKTVSSTSECVDGNTVFPELLVQLAEKSLDAIWPKRKESKRHCRCLIVGSSSFAESIRQYWGECLEYWARENFGVRFCSYGELRAELCKCFDIESTGQVKGDEYDVRLEGVPNVSYNECVKMISDALVSSLGRWRATRYWFTHLPQFNKIYDSVYCGGEQLVLGINLIQKITHDEAIAIRNSLVKNGAIASARPTDSIQG